MLWSNSGFGDIMEAYDIIIMPWLTEKTMEARTTQNRLEFIVRRSATKKQIARAVSTIFEVEVASVSVDMTVTRIHRTNVNIATCRLKLVSVAVVWVPVERCVSTVVENG